MSTIEKQEATPQATTATVKAHHITFSIGSWTWNGEGVSDTEAIRALEDYIKIKDGLGELLMFLLQEQFKYATRFESYYSKGVAWAMFVPGRGHPTNGQPDIFLTPGETMASAIKLAMIKYKEIVR